MPSTVQASDAPLGVEELGPMQVGEMLPEGVASSPTASSSHRGEGVGMAAASWVYVPEVGGLRKLGGRMLLSKRGQVSMCLDPCIVASLP